ncbi:hypothetical protein RN001_006616 [Aquatica leii]|uniref:Uncharacterized protein n=1 Tax=Aquatica leii TaxID=1421715 RepID=A0AAN7Q5L0_9COLE|nr:hypothetical protein RN001_006616 [Aquatica leii]
MIYNFLFCVIFLTITSHGVCAKNACTLFSNASDLKLCRYRNEGLMPIDVWKYKTGVGCYTYLPSQWFSSKISIIFTRLNNSLYDCTIPIGKITSTNQLITFDYQNENYSKYISSSFKNLLYFSKWKKCAQNADLCCSELMDNSNIYPNDEYQCPATWDAWSCFNSAHSNTINELPCPEYTSSSEDVPCILYSQKECRSNGTWVDQTNYATCVTAPIYRKRHSFHVIILYVSLALSLPAVCIFVSYKNLRILRVNLHRNLLIACILRNILTILTKELVILDSLKSSNESNNVLNENGVACRVLAYFNSVCVNAIYACMFVDGYYLHKLIVRVFNRDPNIYLLYLVIAVLSLLPTTIWAIVVAINANDHCWVVDTSWYQWIPDGFRIAILCLNVLLLLDIIKALCKKLSKNVTAQETKYNYILINGKSYYNILFTALMSTLKATFFLLPLFGVPFIITASRNIVDTSSCSAGNIYYYVSYSIQALQSVAVAILFCYWNKEVHNQIRKTYRTVKIAFYERFGLKDNYVNNRRDTAATYVPNQNSVAPPMEMGDFTIKTKVNDWLSSIPTEKDSQQLEMHNNHFNEVSRYIDDSVNNSNTLDNNDVINKNQDEVEIDKLNLNVKFFN